MATVNITEYLKQVSELEASVNRQEQVITQVEQELEQNKPQKAIVKMPVLEKKSLPKREIAIDNGEKETRKNAISGLILGIIFTIIGSSIMKSDEEFGEHFESFAGCIILIAGVIFLIAGIYYAYKVINNKREYQIKNTDLQRKYEQEAEKVKEYNTQQEKAFEHQLAQYEKDQDAANKAYIQEQERYSIAKQASMQLEQSLDETKDTLTKLYALDIIFPKYRNLIAMTTMYEYLASGRCSELKGPNGAYNIYESELRQNIIIGELSAVMTKLEEIKQNQYVLYSEVRKTNKALSDISSDIQMLLNQTAEISAASKIAAFCSQITAQNTAALAYIAIANG